jgi:hypothetical protein
MLLYQSAEALAHCADNAKSIVTGCKNSIGVNASGSKFTLARLAVSLGLPSDSLIEIDPAKSIIQFHGKKTFEGGVAYIDSLYFKQLALSFLKESTPFPMQASEEMCVLRVSYELISTETIQGDKKGIDRVYRSVGVMVGRKIFGLPIFNSFANIIFNAETKSIKFLQLKNWESVQPVVPHGLSNLSEEKIQNLVNAHWNSLQSSANNDVDIKAITVGLQIVPDGLRPAVIHYGTLQNDSDHIWAWTDSL